MRHDDRIEFLIGMRWAHLWKLAWRPWVPRAFAAMLRTDHDDLERTWLAVRPGGVAVVQRWRSADALDAWARDNDGAHAPAWGRFAREHGPIAGWGIWHETRAA